MFLGLFFCFTESLKYFKILGRNKFQIWMSVFLHPWIFHLSMYQVKVCVLLFHVLISQVMVRVINLETKHEWIWSRQKFLNRKYIMQEMYDNFQEGDEWDLPPVSFWFGYCLSLSTWFLIWILSIIVNRVFNLDIVHHCQQGFWFGYYCPSLLTGVRAFWHVPKILAQKKNLTLGSFQ